MSTVEDNLHLLQTLDDTWNSRDWLPVFEKLYAGEVDVSRPGEERPIHGRQSN